MAKFPVDAPKAKVIRTLEMLGFRLLREGAHIRWFAKSPTGRTRR